MDQHSDGSVNHKMQTICSIAENACVAQNVRGNENESKREWQSECECEIQSTPNIGTVICLV